MKRLLPCLFLFLAAVPVLGAQTRGTLSLDISGARSDDGRLMILLFSSKDGFPDTLEKACRVIPVVRLKQGRAFVVFEDLPAGTYAVVVFHDENGNGEIDRNFIGLPTEGLGLSDNPVLFMAPRFVDADIRFDGSNLTLPITVLYIFNKKK
jgi:uncharacterized protein (DUF2141 family)